MNNCYGEKISHSGTKEGHHVVVVFLDGVTDEDLKERGADESPHTTETSHRRHCLPRKHVANQRVEIGIETLMRRRHQAK